MIADWLVDFVHGPVVGFMGTRDAQLRPTLTWVFGARVSAATDEISAFVPDVEFDRTRSNLVHNGIVALTISDPLSTESYQFKGKLVGMRPTTEEEHAVQQIHSGKLAARLAMFPPEFVAGYTYVPSTAVILKVEQAFLQTPGPGAGRQLDPSAER